MSRSGHNLATAIIGVVAGLSGAAVLFILVIICRRKSWCLLLKTIICSHKNGQDHVDVEAFIAAHGSLAPKRYTYSDVKKMTNSFSEKLGKGGYGSVYKGKLSNGHQVAVKVLTESKANGEEFLNEVTSISRTAHVNVVTLLGFCYERKRRALIYEYMPNGSLDKFTPTTEASDMDCPSLEWKTLYQIALGIARGLEYLHQGCNTRILHFDIKPQNILLDQDFSPKISDFGLAKLCKGKESIVSMLGTRGTVGYIAPEVFSRNFGGVSHKSDVYSYGMLVLDMAGGRNKSTAQMSHTGESYFPDSIYRHLERGGCLELPGHTTEEEEIARKLILVGLWCIQTRPSDRPSIKKVIEMLDESNQVLEIPPKPFLSSPASLPHNSFTSSSFISSILNKETVPELQVKL
ncbi:hypothetical protein CRG98_004046 [Punica granatum]|uniref:Protein kinase domain-containing protein n=1 Tax=Punica granatum TaxID=22663 RepID=A0A2I0L4L0_PUNGR|nr:hypothetical protein CRG98_004046 [Punica granatum]